MICAYVIGMITSAKRPSAAARPKYTTAIAAPRGIQRSSRMTSGDAPNAMNDATRKIAIVRGMRNRDERGGSQNDQDGDHRGDAPRQRPVHSGFVIMRRSVMKPTPA